MSHCEEKTLSHAWTRKTSKYTAICLISNVLKAERTTQSRSGSRPILKKRWKQLGFVGVSTVTYRALSEQKQLGAKQFESLVLKGI